MQRQYKNLQGLLLLAFFMYLLVFSVIKFQSIAWGNGNWWGEYSMKWAAAYVVYILLCVLVAVLLGMVLFLPERFRSLFGRFVAFRERLGKTRWLWLFYFRSCPCGSFNSRLWVWSSTIFTPAFWFGPWWWRRFHLFTRGNLFFGWVETLLAVLVTSSEFVIAVAFMEVTNHPFSLGWSEGNRLWDYSIRLPLRGLMSAVVTTSAGASGADSAAGAGGTGGVRADRGAFAITAVVGLVFGDGAARPPSSDPLQRLPSQSRPSAQCAPVWLQSATGRICCANEVGTLCRWVADRLGDDSFAI